MAAEDPRYLLHFRTLKKFNEKLAEGVVSDTRHLCFIADKQLIWCRGKYYNDGTKLGDISNFYNDWELTQTSATTITITIKGKQWDEDAREFKDISKSFTIQPATSTIAGLMSAADKTKVDRITGTNYTISQPTTTDTSRVVTITGINPTTGAAVSSTITLPSASTTQAGLESAADKLKLDGLNVNNVSGIAITSNANQATVTVSKDNGTAADTQSTINFPVASTTAAGTMSAADKTKLNRITGTNHTLTLSKKDGSTNTITLSGINPTDGSAIKADVILATATRTEAGLISADLLNDIEDKLSNMRNFSMFSKATKPADAETSSVAALTDQDNLDMYTEGNLSLHMHNAGTALGIKHDDVTQSLVTPTTGEVINKVTSDSQGHLLTTTKTDLINRAKKLDHSVTINLTDADSKNGVTGTATSNLSGATINIATEISSIDASKITSGTIDLARLPQGALERLTIVANQAAMLALTSSQVQNGDTVKNEATNEMFYVKDQTQLGSMAAFEVYTTGRASEAPWSGITGKPTSIQITNGTNTPISSSAITLGAGAIKIPTTIAAATTTANGLMSSTDKTEHDRITTTNFALGAVTPAAATVAIAASKTNITDGTAVANNITLPAATSTAAGVMTSTDKTELDRITTANFALGTVTSSTTNVVINASKTTISTGAAAANNITLPAATTAAAGVMTKAQVNTLNTLNGYKAFKTIDTDSGTATADAAQDTLTISGGTDIQTSATDTSNADVVTVTHSAVTRSDAAATSPTYTIPANGNSITASTLVKSVTSSATGHVTATASETPKFAHGAVTTTPATTTAAPAFGGTFTAINAVTTSNGHLTGYTTSTVTVPKSTASSTTAGLMSAADKDKLDGISAGANAYTLPLAASGTRGGVQIGYAANGKNYPVRLSSEKMYVNVPWTDTVYTLPTASASVLGGIKVGTGLAITSGVLSAAVTWGLVTEKPSWIGSSKPTYSYSEITNTPTALKNPSALTFTGYSTKSYDGSTAVTVALPTKVGDLENDSGFITSYTDTKNTVGASQSTSTLYPVGVMTAAGTPRSYTNKSVTMTNGKVTATGGFWKESDARLKSNIKPLEHTLEDICSISTVSFTMNGEEQIGTIAQDLEEKFPELVFEQAKPAYELNVDASKFDTYLENGVEYVKVKKVEYEMLSTLAIEGIKLLKAEIDILKAQINK